MLKRNEARAVIKHKPRLFVKGYVQKADVDFNEVFAPFAQMESMRLLLTLVGHEGWPVHHMDVKTVFLRVVLQKEVYVEQPPGLVGAEKKGEVLQLKKALYGFKQAPRAWNSKLDDTLKRLGLQ